MLGAPAGGAVAAGFLGDVECFVGPDDELGRPPLGFGAGVRRDADADGDDFLFAAVVRDVQCAQRRAQLLGHGEGTVFVGVGEDDDELLPAITGRDVGGPAHHGSDALAQRLEAGVASGVAVEVVIGLEAIDIDDENTIIRATVKDEEKAKVLGRGGTNINIAGDLLGYRISLTTIEGAPVDPAKEGEDA